MEPKVCRLLISKETRRTDIEEPRAVSAVREGGLFCVACEPERHEASQTLFTPHSSQRCSRTLSVVSGADFIFFDGGRRGWMLPDVPGGVAGESDIGCPNCFSLLRLIRSIGADGKIWV